MASRSKPSDFKNAEKTNARRKKRRTVSVNGVNINTKTQPDTYRIAKNLKRFNISTNSSISSNEKAKILLGKLSCAVTPEKKDYSLIKSCDDTEVIENENILDLTSYDVSPDPGTAEDKFIDPYDPFYNLDSDIPDSYSDMNSSFAGSQEPDFMCFVAKLYGNGTTNEIMNGAPSATADLPQTSSVGSVTATGTDTTTTTTSY
jgi:hypothetical protein